MVHVSELPIILAMGMGMSHMLAPIWHAFFIVLCLYALSLFIVITLKMYLDFS